jgi:hypothetical protein
MDGELTMLTLITAPITTFDAKIIIASIDHFIQRGFTGERPSRAAMPIHAQQRPP